MINLTNDLFSTKEWSNGSFQVLLFFQVPICCSGRLLRDTKQRDPAVSWAHYNCATGTQIMWLKLVLIPNEFLDQNITNKRELTHFLSITAMQKSIILGLKLKTCIYMLCFSQYTKGLNYSRWRWSSWSTTTFGNCFRSTYHWFRTYNFILFMHKCSFVNECWSLYEQIYIILTCVHHAWALSHRYRWSAGSDIVFN